MRICFVVLAAAASMLARESASAYHDGAPWGAADPAAVENCSGCHFDNEPLQDSAAISIDGWPNAVRPGESYELMLRLLAPDAAIAGFQILVLTATGDAGAFCVAAAAANDDGSPFGDVIHFRKFEIPTEAQK